MSYTINNSVQIPLKIISFYSKAESGIEIKLKLKAQFPSSLTGQNIIIQIPVPEKIEKSNLSSGTGKAKYELQDSQVVWRIKKL